MTKQEPVAWMDDFGNVFEMENKFFHIPLYTAPRELSDEEIISEWIGCDRNYYNFARAILKKATEHE